ncbi:MAG: chromosome segregation protein SMC [Acidimicrobiales bacterium]
MFLKSLTIKGFKSFADATTLVMEPGVTVVVGPNGSGKSNVVDAIGWVLGAQAPSTVRSQKMDDVIFAGTEHRQALGRAEVSLTIDNSSGLLPIEFTEVTLTRILFRTGDSEYSINGVPCRLLDISELLSDSGVGRQQHVIISQGQIDAVLNARAEDRRLIIEEAAGVLKFRRRKEKAERRLTSTEANLTRLQDLLREVRRQLRPLEKQADAARRHGAVVAELNALRLHLAGRELERLGTRLEQGHAARTALADTERELRTTLRRLDAEVIDAEAQLSARGGDDLGDALVRYESLRERARGLAAVVAERRRGIERDRGAFVDQAVVASLESDAAAITSQLRQVEAEVATLAPSAQEVATAREDLELAHAVFAREWAGGVGAPSGAAAEARGELAAVANAVARSGEELVRATARRDGVAARVERLAADTERRRADVARLEPATADLQARQASAHASRVEAEAVFEAASDARRVAEGDQRSWAARAEALSLALSEARAEAGAARLSEVEGVLGTLLDVVAVDPGWESAFEAAAGEAIAAVVVGSVVAGRGALDHLHADGSSGAVLALGVAAAGTGTGEATTVGPLRQHVGGTRPGVDALLDSLVGATEVAPDWRSGVDLAIEHPGAVVVTLDGDRFGPTGWRVGASGSGATGAALAEAETRAAEVVVASAAAVDAVVAARRLLDAAVATEQEVTAEVEANRSRLATATATLPRAERDHADAVAEAEALEAQAVELGDRARRDGDRRSELEARLPALEAEEAQRAERGRAMAEARDRLEARARAVAEQASEHQVRSAGLADRREYLQRRGQEIEERLSHQVEARRDAAVRREELDQRAAATDCLAAFVAGRLEVVETDLAELRERRRRQSEATRAVSVRLDGLRKERSAAEHALSELRERAQRAELEQAEVRVRLEGAVESLRRELDSEPDVAIAAPAPPLPEGFTAPGRVRELERDLRIMGPINPLALEEFEALGERHQFLQDQLEDVKSSRRDLAKVIRAIDAEIVSVFTAAFADVSQNFQDLFETLFPGGKGRLKLTDPDDLLGTGVEVEARPSGKNVRKLSLLSGGERSLTALAYLFAVFRARPSPFYVMDEVEAALDDINLRRFLDLVHEFRQDAQLIVVSHQKRTMEAADCLYGVTMAPGGTSRVVTERVSG